MIRLENRSAELNKFWETEVRVSERGYCLYRRWGRIGTVGQDMRMQFHDRLFAEDELSRLVRQKFNRGYFLDYNRFNLTVTETSILRRMGVANLPEEGIREELPLVRTEETETVTVANAVRIEQQNSQYRKKTNKKLTLRELLS